MNSIPLQQGGPYIFGKANTGKTAVWGAAGTFSELVDRYRREIKVPPTDQQHSVVGRRVSNSLVVPGGAYLWRNGQIRDVAALCGNPANWNDFNITQVSPEKNFLIGTAAKDDNGDGKIDVGTAEKPGPDKRHGVLLLPVQLVDTKGTLLDSSSNVIISPKLNADDMNPAAIAWIEPHGATDGVGPTMPWPVLEVGGDGSAGYSIRWKLTVQYSRPNGNAVTDGTMQIPTSAHSQDGWVTEPVNGGPVQIYSNMDWIDAKLRGFFGGRAQLTFQLLKADNTTLMDPKIILFDIGGKKPDPGIAKTYIDQQARIADSRLVPLSYAVARHESKDYNGEGSRYNQSWESYGHRYKADHRDGDPLWCKSLSESSAGGFGMFQITGDLTSPFSNIPRQQMWNWEWNTLAYINFVKTGGSASKGSVMDRFFAAVARTYPNDTEAQNPPANYSYDGKTLDAWTMGTITLYNGAGGCPKSKLLGSSGKIVPLTNPWKFTSGAAAGTKWKYYPNSNGYLVQVIQQANQ